MSPRRSLRGEARWLISLLAVSLGLLALAATPGWTQAIQVKVLVDEEEPALRRLWQERLGKRIRAASDVLSNYCSLRFVPTVYDTWKSDDRIKDLSQTLREFEREVDPAPAQIAIGFSSQYRFQRGHNNLGGIRGPMNTHILIRENAPNVRETERLEVLVHELGHFLGAAHSTDANSVMRPILGDGKSRAVNHRIRFDPENARIIQRVAQEIRDLRVRHYYNLSPQTMQVIRKQYQSLAAKAPNDPVTSRYLSILDARLKHSRPGRAPATETSTNRR